MEWNRVFAFGLGSDALAELSERLKDICPKVEIESLDLAAEPPRGMSDEGALFTFPLGTGGEKSVEYLGDLRERGVMTPALLLAPDEVLSQELPLEDLGAVDLLLQDHYTTLELRRALRQLRFSHRKAQEIAELKAQIRRFEDLQIQQQLAIEQLSQDLGAAGADHRLAGLHDERYMAKNVDLAFHLARRHQTPVSCLLVSIDDFARIGERFDAAFADLITTQIAHRLRGAMRGTDLLSRYSEGSFLLLTPFTPRHGASLLAERLLQAVAGQRLEHPEQRLHLTLSIGVATLAGEMESSTEMIETALEALGRARTAGGNRIYVM